MNIQDLKVMLEEVINKGEANNFAGELDRHKLLLTGEKIAKANGIKLNSTQLNELTTTLTLEHWGRGGK